MKDKSYFKDMEKICNKYGVRGALGYIIATHCPSEAERTAKLIDIAEEKLGSRFIFSELRLCIPGLPAKTEKK